KELLKSYKNLLNDNTKIQIEKLKEEQRKYISTIQEIKSPIIFYNNTFGNTEDGKILQPTRIVEYNTFAESLKNSLLIIDIEKASSLAYNFVDCINEFSAKKNELHETLQRKQVQLADLSKAEQDLLIIINELKDRKLFASKIIEIKNAINNKTIVSKLIDNKVCFNTTAISKKTSEARDELIQNDFITIFGREIQNLRKSNIRIDLSFATVKGQSKVQQKISSYLLSDVLSEGEQKAFAMAEFFTELQLDSSFAPVIFDDPVNSLDHNIIDDVCKRLLLLSTDRQVIIFTHNILLLNSFLVNSKIKTFEALECNFYDIKTNFELSGYISESEESIDRVNRFVKKIDTLINNTPKGSRLETEIAAEGYGLLRSTIELLVEQNIFNNTIRRYQKNVALTNFIKVDGALLDECKHTIYDLFDRCSGFTNAHSEPLVVTNEPSLNDLKQDLQLVKDLIKKFS
ncbi:MAG: hypothetical protein JSS96_13665, partial [Bacteroidetes bacterium]|nr:hypothetical protein [Bacteroidota bacterium]